MIPVSVIVMTRNEAARLPRCLAALKDFSEVFVVDSASTDGTQAAALEYGARVIPYVWDRRYPKKKQWCLDHLPFSHDWVFYVDADEVVSAELKEELRALFSAGPKKDGYFIAGRMVWQGRILRHGMHNNKLCFFNRHKFIYPAVDDLGLPGMGEVEGHYQPVPRPGCAGVRLGKLSAAMEHYGADDPEEWLARHRRYALWEAGMNARKAWPRDALALRQALKTIFRTLPRRDLAAFIHAYIWKRGFLDGRAGLDYARKRAAYYRMIRNAA